MTDETNPVEAPFVEALYAEVLFTVADARTPDPEFAATLRRRVAEAADVPDIQPQEATMTVAESAHTAAHTTARTTTHSYRPAGAAAITPYLIVSDARAAIAWYQDILGARVTYEPIIMDDGRIGHVELDIDGSTIQMADEFPDIGAVSPQTLGGSAISLSLYVPDCDVTFAHAVEAGATGDREPADQFYGARSASITDPFGHRWSLQTHLGADGEPTEQGASGDEGAHDFWNEVGYYVVHVPRLDPALAFWGGLFGWTFESEREASGGVGRYSHVDNSRVPLGIRGDDDSWQEQTWSPYFRVRDLNAAVARVRELGGTIESVTDYESGGNATCLDDQGVRFELWQPADGY
jgi:uncharacterized glyoxalase superfamily protein PhnB